MDVTFKKALKSFLAYRVHVIAMGFLLALYVNRIQDVTADIFFAAVSFAVLIGFIYIFNKTTDLKEDRVNVAGDHPQFNNIKYVQIFLYGIVLLPLVFLKNHPFLLVVYFLSFLNGFFYSFPMPVSGKKLRFKSIFILKNISAAFIWAIPPAAVSLYFEGSLAFSVVYFIEVFCIAFTIELLWDLRDIQGDRLAGIKTIANQFGVKATKAIALLLLLVAILLVDLYFPNIYSYLGIIGSSLFILFFNEKRSHMYFHNIVFMWIVLLTLRLIFGEVA